MTIDPAEVIGRYEADALGGPELGQALDELENVHPELARYTIRRGLGDAESATNLDHREYALLTVATLAALGDTSAQLAIYAAAARRHGATAAELRDVLMLTCAYAGTPRAVTATRAAPESLHPAATGVRETVMRLADHDTGLLDGGEGGGGAGPPMLLMHALCMDRHYWRAVLPTLIAKGRILAYDLRAHGVARGAPPPTSLNQMADDAARLLDALEVDRVDVYGASYGGAVAQHFALAHPDRVRALGLIATGAWSPRETLQERARRAELHGMAAQVAESLHRWFLPDSIAENGWAVRYARAKVLRARVEDWAASWRTMAQLDVRDRLPEMTMPTLVVSGQQDLSSTPEMMRDLADGLPDGRYVPADPGTHMITLEQPDTLADALATFRDQLQGRE